MNYKRNSNIEWLRIISMMMIVIGHYVSQNNIVTWNLSLNDGILWLMGSGSRIATNIFLIIGVYFMLDATFKAERITSMYGQTIFYTYSLTVISLFISFSRISKKDILRGIAPFWGRALWFVSAYITLMFVAPYLNQIIHSFDRKKLRLLVVLLLFFVSFVSTLPDTQSGYLCDSIWFWVVYIIIGYLKKYNIFEYGNKTIPLFLGIVGYVCLVMISYVATFNNSKIITIFGSLAKQYLVDIKTLPNFAIALCVFTFVLKIKERNNKIIIKLARTTFPIYIFHQVPAFYSILWEKIYDGENWRNNHLLIWPIFVFITLFIIVTIVEMPRKMYLEPVWKKNKYIIKINNKLDELYQKFV